MKKSLSFLAVGVLTAWLLAALPAAGDPLEAVKAADLAMSKAVLDKDRAAFETFLAPQAIFLDAAEPGRESAIASWSPFFAEKRQALLQWKPDGGKVAAAGDFAYTTGPYEFRRPGPDGKSATVTGRYLTIWQKSEGGRWQVWADGSWLDPAAGPFTAHLSRLFTPAGRPDAALKLERRPVKTAKSSAGDLLLVVGEIGLDAGDQKAQGRYATVSEPDGEGGWRVLAEAAFIAGIVN